MTHFTSAADIRSYEDQMATFKALIQLLDDAHDLQIAGYQEEAKTLMHKAMGQATRVQRAHPAINLRPVRSAIMVACNKLRSKK